MIDNGQSGQDIKGGGNSGSDSRRPACVIDNGQSVQDIKDGAVDQTVDVLPV